jgi:hypothetical protein
MIDRVTADIILDKCKSKKDGVYSYKGIPYMKCNGDIFIGMEICIRLKSDDIKVV